MMRKLFFPLLVLFGMAAGAGAHFLTDAQSREIHVSAGPDGTVVLMRLPLTFAYARELAAQGDPAGTVAGAFLAPEVIGGTTYYRVDAGTVDEDLAMLALRDIAFTAAGAPVQPTLDRAGRFVAAPGAPLPSGRSALEEVLADPIGSDSAYVSEIHLVLSLNLDGVGVNTDLGIEIAGPDFTLPEGIHFATQVIDHRPGEPQVFDYEGFWPPRIELTGGALATFGHYIWQGVEHILLGVDHVLFVLCLALAASGARALVWTVTGFTLGHSVTLAAGVLGLVPSGLWFIPLVELGIALSIVAMAVLVIWRRRGRLGFLVAAALGLLHGYGFAFMLAPMLDGTGLALPLIGFNLGVELGQLAIVLPVFAAFALAARHFPRPDRLARIGVATAAGAVALLFTAARVTLLWPYLTGALA